MTILRLNDSKFIALDNIEFLSTPCLTIFAQFALWANWATSLILVIIIHLHSFLTLSLSLVISTRYQLYKQYCGQCCRRSLFLLGLDYQTAKKTTLESQEAISSLLCLQVELYTKGNQLFLGGWELLSQTLSCTRSPFSTWLQWVHISLITTIRFY